MRSVWIGAELKTAEKGFIKNIYFIVGVFYCNKNAFYKYIPSPIDIV